MVEELESYLYASIADIQGTIRALDTKAGFVFVVLSIPFSNLGKFYGTCHSFASSSISNPYIFYPAIVLIAIFLLSWAAAFVSTIRAIVSIDNPSDHIVNSNDLSGSFYCGGLFDLGLIDSLINRESIRAGKDVNKHFDSLPTSPESIIKELSFEQIKLAYIRDIKSIRQKWAYKFTATWLLSGFMIYILNKLTMVCS